MFTFNDAQQQLADSFTFNVGKDRLGRLARKAVTSAYSDLGAKSAWNYLRRTTLINTIAGYQTGTIEYVAATRTLILTDGVFPMNSVASEVLINRNIYRVQKRVDNTHLILLEGNCPVQDIVAGTSYVVVQTQYILPPDWLELRGITETAQLWNVVYVPPEVMLAMSQWWSSPTQPWYYTIIGAGGAGRMYIQFLPPPNVNLTFSVIYQAKPRVFTMNGQYSQGRVATTSGSTTVTLTGGVFPSGVSRGCVFRLGDEAVPTGVYGDTPYIEERLVATRTSDTEIELQDPMDTTASNACYAVDDPVDIEPTSMQSYFDRLCEARLLRLHQATRTSIQEAEQAAAFALKEGQAMDSRMNPSANVNPILANIPTALFYSAQVHP